MTVARCHLIAVAELLHFSPHSPFCHSPISKLPIVTLPHIASCQAFFLFCDTSILEPLAFGPYLVHVYDVFICFLMPSHPSCDLPIQSPGKSWQACCVVSICFDHSHCTCQSISMAWCRLESFCSLGSSFHCSSLNRVHQRAWRHLRISSNGVGVTG